MSSPEPGTFIPIKSGDDMAGGPRWPTSTEKIGASGATATAWIKITLWNEILYQRRTARSAPLERMPDIMRRVHLSRSSTDRILATVEGVEAA
jgi:hypothetical protein